VSIYMHVELTRNRCLTIYIQRGRDHGIADYNTVRESYGLKRKNNWTDINPFYNTQVETLRVLSILIPHTLLSHCITVS